MSRTARHTLDCSHAFHTECIREWLRRANHTCPLCRENVLLERLLHVQSSTELDSFARRYEGQSLESLLLAMFDSIGREIGNVESSQNKWPQLSFDFIATKMARLLIDHSSLCAQNRATLERLCEAVSTTTIRGAQHNEEKWQAIVALMNSHLGLESQ